MVVRNEYAEFVIVFRPGDKEGDESTYTVGKEQVTEILIVDFGARLVVTKQTKGSKVYRTSVQGPFARMAWVPL